MKPLKIIPFVMVDAERAMVLTTRRWKPEPYWCGHGRRTWIVPLPNDPAHGRRFHGEQESFGAVLEVAGCDSTVRLRRASHEEAA